MVAPVTAFQLRVTFSTPGVAEVIVGILTTLLAGSLYSSTVKSITVLYVPEFSPYKPSLSRKEYFPVKSMASLIALISSLVYSVPRFTFAKALVDSVTLDFANASQASHILL